MFFSIFVVVMSVSVDLVSLARLNFRLLDVERKEHSTMERTFCTSRKCTEVTCLSVR
jgi:hypothetical protein